MDNISISLSENGRGRDVSAIRVDGVIDTLTASELEQVFDSLLRRGRYRIVVDLAGVDYISSAGWGIFISHIKDVRDNDGDVKLANMVPDVMEIFELLEFDKVLQAYRSVDDAVQRFAAPSGNSSSDAADDKKKSGPTTLKVVEDISPASNSGNGSTGPAPNLQKTAEDLELFALQMLKNDPFVTISEIRRDFAQNSNGLRASWWKIFRLLRRNRLLRRRSRFRYAWGRA
jgi:anti-sigma B factor antagonist